MALHHALLILVAHVIVIHLFVLGFVAWFGGQNAWVKAITITVTCMVLVMTYVLESFYARRIIRRKVRGREAFALFMIGYTMVLLAHSAVMFSIELLWPVSLASLSGPADSAPFGVFYTSVFPLVVGVFNTVGNANAYPVGLIASIWWAWTSVLGVVHIGFILSFLAGKFSSDKIRAAG